MPDVLGKRFKGLAGRIVGVRPLYQRLAEEMGREFRQTHVVLSADRVFNFESVNLIWGIIVFLVMTVSLQGSRYVLTPVKPNQRLIRHLI